MAKWLVTITVYVKSVCPYMKIINEKKFRKIHNLLLHQKIKYPGVNFNRGE